MKMSEGCISFSGPSSKFLHVKTECLSQPIQNVMTTGYSLFMINKMYGIAPLGWKNFWSDNGMWKSVTISSHFIGWNSYNLKISSMRYKDAGICNENFWVLTYYYYYLFTPPI